MSIFQNIKMKTETLFKLEDTVLKMPGLYTLWSVLYWTNLYVLFNDSTESTARTFNVLITVMSTLYCGGAALNNIYGNKMPSTLLVSAGPVHQYSFWLLFAYFGGSSSVLGSSGIALMNWVHSIVVALFTVDMVVKTWYTSLYTDKYLEYVKNFNNVVESTSV